MNNIVPFLIKDHPTNAKKKKKEKTNTIIIIMPSNTNIEI